MVLKWKPASMQTIDFEVRRDQNGKAVLYISGKPFSPVITALDSQTRKQANVFECTAAQLN